MALITLHSIHIVTDPQHFHTLPPLLKGKTPSPAFRLQQLKQAGLKRLQAQAAQQVCIIHQQGRKKIRHFCFVKKDQNIPLNDFPPKAKFPRNEIPKFHMFPYMPTPFFIFFLENFGK